MHRFFILIDSVDKASHNYEAKEGLLENVGEVLFLTSWSIPINRYVIHVGPLKSNGPKAF